MDIIYRIFDLVITIRDTRWLLCCVAKTTRRELVENNYIRSRGKPKRFTNVLLRCKVIKFGSITQPWGRSLLRGLLQTWRDSKVLFAKKWKKLWEDSKSFFYIVSAQVVGKRGEGEVRANEVSGPHKACSHSSPFDVYIQRKAGTCAVELRGAMGGGLRWDASRSGSEFAGFVFSLTWTLKMSV